MKKIAVILLSIGVVSLSFLKQEKKKDKKKKAKTEIKDDVKPVAKADIKVEAKSETLFWYTDVMKADSVSKKVSKPIFAFFTGSDWCGWCHKLQREVFAKKEFIEWANDKVVLLELDFPRHKTLAPELQQQNAGLQQAFNVNGFPTIWMFYLQKNDSTNKINLNALGSLGYPSNPIPGKEEIAFLDNANKILTGEKKQ